MSTCLPTPTATCLYTLSAVAQLPTTGTYSSAHRHSFVQRDVTNLQLDGQDFKVVGPNVYWLGLDENVDPNPSYPAKGRILEVMAIASAMGATTIRSQTLGISVGTGLSVENALNTFKANDSAAWDAIDFAVFAARSYNLRLILPLTDQYDYYHGGIPTMLRWRNLSDTDFSPFYDTRSEVYSDFERYVKELLGHVSAYTNLSLATDPTVLAFETGNELGSWSGSSYPPPVEWTTSIAQLLKELAPNTLVMDGSYGVRKESLGIEAVDMYSDHFYPLYTSRLSSSASRAHSANKAFLAGEYDWTNNLYSRLRWAWWAMAIPVVLAALVWVMPRRWWPKEVTIRGVVTCGRCRRKGRKRKEREAAAGQARGGYLGESTSSPPLGDLTASPATTPLPQDSDKPLFPTSGSSAALPIFSSSASSTSFPPSTSSSRQARSASHRQAWLDRPFFLHRWHLSLLILIVFLPILGALLHTYLPSSISSFLSTSTSLSSTSSSSGSPRSTGDLYWSLFSRDSSCCDHVNHHDGYTLHYPSDPSSSNGPGKGSGERVAELTRHAWGIRGERPFWLEDDTGKEVKDLRLEDLPVVACPQEGLRLENGTVIGGAR
ncbi:hypothetical protein JCM11641_006529 [Rhodosporidiobolus odoratus]